MPLLASSASFSLRAVIEFFERAPWAQQLLLTVAIVLVLYFVRKLAIRGMDRRIEDPELLFRSRRVATYITTAVGLLALIPIWVENVRDIATFLGIIGAGLVIALQEVVQNFAGWIYISLRHPFKVGDRVEIGGHAGDVIDVRVLRFSLLEIRSWVDADQSTGRILHLPNGLLFTQPLANFTQGFRHIWHEVPLLVTFESDWQKAKAILQEALEDHAMTEAEVEAAEDIRRASRQFFIRYSTLSPIVYVSVRESGVLLTGRVLVASRRRRTIDNEIWEHVLRRFAEEPSVEFAYSTTRFFRRDGEDRAGAPVMHDEHEPGHE